MSEANFTFPSSIRSLKEEIEDGVKSGSDGGLDVEDIKCRGRERLIKNLNTEVNQEI